MPNVTSFQQRTRRLVIDFDTDDEESLTVLYRPRAITPRMERAFQALNQSGDADQVIFDSLNALIVSWDLTDDAGTELPRTKDALQDVPSSLLLHVFQKIAQDLNPNAQPSETSRNGSAPTVIAEPSRTGTSFSS